MYYVGIDLGGTNIVAGVVDENFKILAKADCKTAFGTFISVPVTQGSHTIEMKYTPPLFALGLTVSLLTLLGVLAAAFRDRIGKLFVSWR